MYSQHDYLVPGSEAQLAAVSGIVDHAYEKHGDDIPWASREEFGNAAMSDLNSADHVYEFINDNGELAFFFTNSETQMVGWINTSDLSSSTYYSPGPNFEEYIMEQIENKGFDREISTEELQGFRGEVVLEDPQTEEQTIQQETPEVTAEAVPETSVESETVADEPAVEVSDEAPSVDADATEGPER